MLCIKEEEQSIAKSSLRDMRLSQQQKFYASIPRNYILLHFNWFLVVDETHRLGKYKCCVDSSTWSYDLKIELSQDCKKEKIQQCF